MSEPHDDTESPREVLHQRVRSHLRTLREAGIAANRTIALGGAVLEGWLIDDPFSQATSRRWLLMNDGDVWCEAAYVATPWAADQGVSYGWLSAPTAALEAVLELSADEVRDGGDGLLAGPSRSGAPHRVADRRSDSERRAASEDSAEAEADHTARRHEAERRAGRDRRRRS